MLDAAAKAQIREAQRLLDAGAFEQAYALCGAVHQRFPQAAEPHVVLADMFLRRNMPGRALSSLARIGPDVKRSGYAHALAAEAQYHFRQIGAAVAAAESAVAAADGDAQTLIMAARIFSASGRIERAVAVFSTAYDIAPAVARGDLAAALHVSGRFEEAEQLYRALLVVDRRQPMVWHALSQLRPGAISATDRAELEQERRGADADDALLYVHTMAKALEDEQRYPAAIEAVREAKYAKRRAFSYGFEGFDAPMFEAAKASPPASAPSRALSEQPVFIIGLPRTGTTLVERILTSHGDAASLGETDEFPVAIQRVANATAPSVFAPETLAAGAGADATAIGETFLAQILDRAEHPRARLIDKMPLNFFFAGLIHRALPNARIICIRRGAMDSVIANYMQFFRSDSIRYAFQFDLADTARFYAAFDDLSAHWRVTLPADRYTELQYEHLVADQEAETRRLLDFCGLDWDPRCLAFHENKSAAMTASAVQVRQPLYSSSVGRWKRYGDAVKPALDMLAQFGIAPDAPPL